MAKQVSGSKPLQFVEGKETDCSSSFINSYTSSCMKVEHDAPQGQFWGQFYFCCIYVISQKCSGGQS
jgi:hypothetical protein